MMLTEVLEADDEGSRHVHGQVSRRTSSVRNRSILRLEDFPARFLQCGGCRQLGGAPRLLHGSRGASNRRLAGDCSDSEFREMHDFDREREGLRRWRSPERV
jgi:hypothetical protein